MSRFENAKTNLITTPKTWLVTGVAGFIGSNLLESLLFLGQQVVGLDLSLIHISEPTRL